KEEVLLNVIGFVDIMEHAIAGSKNAKSVNAVIDGIELVHKELLSMLKRNNVDVVETDCVKFDPVCHEAVEQVKDNTVEENTVVGEFQKGYKINGRVIRAAKVKVSKKEENTEPKSDKNGEKE
ncbi:MAG: nucleotide exchange factor GrpE, partial [Elusimicrobiota bacterium]